MAHVRILDLRTDPPEPAAYPALLQEARELAEKAGYTLPAACRRIATEANPDKAESIDRTLRRLREQAPASTTPTHQPPAGFWAIGAELQRYAEELQDSMSRTDERQGYSSHRMKQLAARAKRLLEIAEERERYLKTVTGSEAVAAIRPFLKGLGEVDPEMAPELFVSSERRLVELVAMISSRVLDKAKRSLEWLED